MQDYLVTAELEPTAMVGSSAARSLQLAKWAIGMTATPSEVSAFAKLPPNICARMAPGKSDKSSSTQQTNTRRGAKSRLIATAY